MRTKEGMIEALKQLLPPKQEKSSAATRILDDMARRRAEFERRREAVRKDMERGAHITEHRISL